MGKRELQIKGNSGKLGLSGEKCVHMNCLMFQGKKYSPVNLPFNPLNFRTEVCLPVRVWKPTTVWWWGGVELATSCPTVAEMECDGLDTAPVWSRSLRSMRVVKFLGLSQHPNFSCLSLGRGWPRSVSSWDPGRWAWAALPWRALGPCRHTTWFC